MSLEKRLNLYFVGTLTVIGLMVYFYPTFFCRSLEECYKLEVSFLEPVFFVTLGYLITSSCLIFFQNKVFHSWLKHIAWWFLLLTIICALTTDPYTSGVLSVDRSQTTMLLMVVLFIITLIYAVVMNHRYKKQSK